MKPGQNFTKTWRLQNTGTCTWTKDYSMAVFSGESMDAPSVVQMPSSVAPGQSVDISVDLTAPSSAGSYQGNWKLRNKEGAWFGIGPGGSSPFWVRIVVSGTATTPSATTSAGTPYPSNGTPAPGVLVSGSTTMLILDRINFDTGQINPGGGEDLGFVIDGERPLLVPQGSALQAIAWRRHTLLRGLCRICICQFTDTAETAKPGDVFCATVRTRVCSDGCG